MKPKHLIFFPLNLLSILLFAQEKKTTDRKVDVPAVVQAGFVKSFPASSAVTWEKEKGDYEANFVSAGKNMSALLTSDGKLLETETTIQVNELPPAIKTWVSSQYKNPTIHEAARIVKSNGEINYEAEVDKKDLIFDQQGRFLRKE